MTAIQMTGTCRPRAFPQAPFSPLPPYVLHPSPGPPSPPPPSPLQADHAKAMVETDDQLDVLGLMAAAEE